MKKQQIIEIINDTYLQYREYKDGGREFINKLSLKLLNTVEEDKNDVFNFFLNEIENDENGFMSIALSTIEEMKAIELGPFIIKIYEKNKFNKNDEWKYDVIITLLKIKYLQPQSIYYNFIKEYYIKYPDESYFILTIYCTVNLEEGLNFLSDFYSRYLLNDIEMQSFLESRIGFLVSYFLKNSISLIEVLKKLIVKDINTAKHLKKILLNYLNGKFIKVLNKEYDEDKIIKEIEKIQCITL